MDLLEEYVSLIIPTGRIEGPKVCIGAKTFQIIFDYRPFTGLLEKYSPKETTSFKRVTPISKEEYSMEIEHIKEDMNSLFKDHERLQEFIDKAPKKKNGTFIVGRVFMRIPYYNTSKLYRGYGANSWSYYTLKVKTWEDTVLMVYLDRECS